MKKVTFISLIAILAILLTAVGAAAAGDMRTFTAKMTGAGHGNDSDALGSAQFKFNKDGESLSYRVFVKHLEDTTQAHIHLAPEPGGSGPIVLWLYPDAPPPLLIPGFFTGLLGQRKVTASDLVGPLAGMTLEDLKQAMLDGRAYVNVHTNEFPAGEIRGDIHPKKKK
jgi:hypothetical protein